MAADGIGARVRMARQARGLSLRTAAGLAGMSKSVLHAFETGVRPLDRLSHIDNLAGVLGVSRAWLLGQPAEPTTARSAGRHHRIERIRVALMGTELGVRPEVEPRPLPALTSLARSAGATLHRPGRVGEVADTLPALLTELHAWAASGDERQQCDALRALVLACAATCGTIKWFGHPELVWIAGERGRQAAHRLGEPVWIGLAEFYRSPGATAYSRTLSTSEQAIEALLPHVGDGLSMQVAGMLHQMAAFGAAVVGRAEATRSHLDEAAGLAARTGDRTDLDLFFGPTNLAIWRVSIAVEQGDGGRATEIAQGINLRAMPSVMRQANLLADLGRGFVQERRDAQALNAFRSAERLVPEVVRGHPLVREATGRMLYRSRQAAAGSDLRAFAHRVGVLE